jgi:hypothetical protein
MVELGDEGPHGLRDHGVIDEYPGRLIDRAAHGDSELETVTVDLAALMPCGKLGQRLGRLELEILREDDDHASLLPPRADLSRARRVGRFSDGYSANLARKFL